MFSPPLLKLFVESLLTNDSNPSERVTRLTKSIGQDIIYASSRGRIKTIKHLQLGLFTKRKTGSKLLISCLNRLGHCLSYDEINNVETSFADQQAHRQLHRDFVPNNVQPSEFITFVYDNCDHNPETLNGQSMHFTNGIIIQKATGESRLSVSPTKAHPKRKRSFQAMASEVQPYYAPKERCNPRNVQQVEFDRDAVVEHISKMHDTIWILSRLKASEEFDKQTQPSWTGFHYEVAQKSELELHAVHYLPAINQSPTKFDTIQEILLQVKEKSERLNLPSADLVLDHAIYSKALEVLSNPQFEACRKFINLRMGGFHACGIFIAVIGKRFASAGLRDVIIESDLLGSSSVDSTLKGQC